MITIIAGKINKGKSTTMENLYKQTQKGDGFVCKKVYKFGHFYGYEFQRLSTGEVIPFMIESSMYQNQDDFNKVFRSFNYSQKALDEVLLTIKKLIKDGVEPIYLDEIGNMELSKKGNDEALLAILRSKKDAVICVRDSIVYKVIEHYRLNNYRIVGVKNE